MEKIVFTPAGEEAVEFYVLEQTRLGGIDYILVTDSEQDDSEALILRDVSAPEEEEAIYEIVTDDEELDAVAAVFENMLEDIELL
ncbi:MAG: DUF1292 domain-containing protein [Clostridiales bacterium]|nr:DUF1292 domain-containing protein [Clostridiales bacterium]